jgi:AraC family ethanolamine operon transcriptional activator
MDIFALPPSAIFRAASFHDLDRYRDAFRSVQNVTPIARDVDARHAMVTLPGCDIYLLETFPRVLDAAVNAGTTFIGFTMDDGACVRLNGFASEQAGLVLGHGGAGYKIFETARARAASIVFTPEIAGRGWPEPGDALTPYPISPKALTRLRDIVRLAFETAIDPASRLREHDAARGLRETLLCALDAAFGEGETLTAARLSTARRHFDIVHKVETALFRDIQAPVYSEDLARDIGVSVRTLHNAMLQYRGMSLHRYLRLKRLWAVRRELLSGNGRVKTSAVAHGFWHLGEFSALYFAQFGEQPSQTLARARG